MFDWTGFFTVASNLALCDNEASRRSAISRAYYCAFHKACMLVEHEGIWLPKDGRAHRDVWSILKSQGGSRLIIGENGRALLNARLVADYSHDHFATPLETNNALGLARRIIERLAREMRTTPSPRQRR